MAELTCQIVRPDRMLFEGKAASIVIVTHTGELGIWPGHAAEICAMGDGVMRMTRLPEDGGEVRRIVISGGYAEISDDTVLVLADHARDITDIDPTTVTETRQKALDRIASLPEGDHRRAYYENKVAWCDLLLAEVPGASEER